MNIFIAILFLVTSLSAQDTNMRLFLGREQIPVPVRIIDRGLTVIKKYDVAQVPGSSNAGFYISRKAATFVAGNQATELQEFLLDKALFRDASAVAMLNELHWKSEFIACAFAVCEAFIGGPVLYNKMAGEVIMPEALEVFTIAATIFAAGIVVCLGLRDFADSRLDACERAAVDTVCARYTSRQLYAIAGQFSELHPKTCWNNSTHAMVRNMLKEKSKKKLAARFTGADSQS